MFSHRYHDIMNVKQHIRDQKLFLQVIYKCRDHTETVGNLSLQTSSILCKKAAENISTLVLDIKCGKGCYQPSFAYAEKVTAILDS